MIRHILPRNVVAQLMLSGEVIPAEKLIADCAAHPRLASTMHRFATYIWDLRQYEGALIKTVKDGRKIVSYHLANAKAFNEYGQIAQANQARTRQGKFRKPIVKGDLPKGDVTPKFCGGYEAAVTPSEGETA